MKKLLISFLFIFTCLSTFAENIENLDENAIINNIFQNTVKSFYNNPASMNNMLNEIQRNSSVDILELVKEIKTDNIDFNNKDLINYLSNKIETDSKFVEKIFLEFGQTKLFSNQKLNDEQVKEYLIKKTESSEEFRKELYLLLSRKDKKILSEFE